jgi:hypothetical protein
MIRDELLRRICTIPEGVPPSGLQDRTGLNSDSEDCALIEALLLLSPEVRYEGGVWRPVSGNRAFRVLAEIRRYSAATGKRIFRLSSALAELPPQEHPTEEELKVILAATEPEFELLPNAMVKRINRQ